MRNWVPNWREEQKEWRKIFEEITAENFSGLVKELNLHVQERTVDTVEKGEGGMDEESSDDVVTLSCNYEKLWRRKWQPTPVFLLGESHGQRSLMGYRSWGCKESDMTERETHTCVKQILCGKVLCNTGSPALASVRTLGEWDRRREGRPQGRGSMYS